MSWALFKKKNKEEVWGFPSGSDGKESAHNVGDPGSIPGLGGSPEEGNGYSLQYFCLEFHGQSSLADPCGHKESGTIDLLTLFLITFTNFRLDNSQFSRSLVSNSV